MPNDDRYTAVRLDLDHTAGLQGKNELLELLYLRSSLLNLLLVVLELGLVLLLALLVFLDARCSCWICACWSEEGAELAAATPALFEAATLFGLNKAFKLTAPIARVMKAVIRKAASRAGSRFFILHLFRCVMLEIIRRIYTDPQMTGT